MNSGGPAFPHTADQYQSGMEGMSMRDWFAGQALQGIISGKYHMDACHNPEDKTLLVSIAWCAYVLADAMLAERVKEVSHD